MSKNYIEFRVYLKDTDKGDEKYVELVAAAADDLHDTITDLLDESELIRFNRGDYMMYHIEDAHEGEKCHECGGEATILIVADYSERDTGYVDEMPLCEDCAEKRES